jgi:uncharacterized tellurite resistance protein B-like protein
MGLRAKVTEILSRHCFGVSREELEELGKMLEQAEIEHSVCSSFRNNLSSFDDNTRLTIQNLVMYALRAESQESPIVRKFWELK